MGSPVSPVFANHCMEIIEESAISASATPPRVWKRYVDDSFVIIEKTTVSTFHDTLNSIDPKISFTIDTENNGQISFLDTLVSRKDGVVTIDGVVTNLPSTSAGKWKELIYVINALESNGYPQSFISNILKKKPPPETTPSPEELVGCSVRWLPRVSTKETTRTGKTYKRNPSSVVVQSLYLNFTSKVTNIITLDIIFAKR